MRILLTFSINPEKGDELIKEGRIGETMGSILEELQPEAAYFTDVKVHEVGSWSSIWKMPPRCLL